MTYVYFVQSGRGGPIKIGKARDPKVRLRELQVGNPVALTLLATLREEQSCDCREERWIEKSIQNRFSDLRIRGEWYRPERPLLYFIQTVRKHLDRLNGWWDMRMAFERNREKLYHAIEKISQMNIDDIDAMYHGAQINNDQRQKLLEMKK
jgi:hypothetical protein